MTVNATKLDLEITYTETNGMTFRNLVFTDENLNDLLSKMEVHDANPFSCSPLDAREDKDFWSQENVLLIVRTAMMYTMSTPFTCDHVFAFFTDAEDWFAVRLNTAMGVSVMLAS